MPSEKDPISRRFVYPQDCQIDGLIDRDVFRREMWRFQARCQPAFTGYAEFFADPRFIDGNLIIFSEDIFGVMFIESQVLSIFERVKESLCDTQFSNVLQKLPEDDFDTWFKNKYLSFYERLCCFEKILFLFSRNKIRVIPNDIHISYIYRNNFFLKIEFEINI